MPCLLLQKNFTPNPLTHKRVKNRGELPQYYVSGNHEAIVSDELWQAVQDKIKDAHDFNPAAGRIIKPYEFTKKITCCRCENHYTRNVSRISKTERIEIWYCYGKIKHGKDFCPSLGLREDRLKEAARQVLGLEEFDSKVFTEQIEQIFTTETGELEFRFYDGTVKRVPIKVFEKKKTPS